MCGLNKERLHKIDKLKDERESVSINKSSKSEYRYWLVVRLKAIEYKENFSHYLSFYFYCHASLQTFLSLLSQDIIFFDYPQILYYLFYHCKKEVAYTRLGYILLQKYSASINKA